VRVVVVVCVGHSPPDLHALSLQPQSLHALAEHFAQFPQTHRELEVAAEGSLDSAWDAEEEDAAAANQGSGKRQKGPPPLLMRPFSSVSQSQAATLAQALANRIARDAELAAVQAGLPLFTLFSPELGLWVGAFHVILQSKHGSVDDKPVWVHVSNPDTREWQPWAQAKRASLPVNEFKDEILSVVAANQVVLIAGSTVGGLYKSNPLDP
jgi:hypothetical protein